MKNKAKKAVSKSLEEKNEVALAVLKIDHILCLGYYKD